MLIDIKKRVSELRLQHDANQYEGKTVKAKYGRCWRALVRTLLTKKVDCTLH